MADISKIQLPNGNEYDLKDTVARVTIPYGAVDSTSTSTAFTATVDGITELKDGVCVYLDNNVVASASGWTLNINGLGAKPVYFSSSNTRTTTHFGVAVTALFVYNSSHVTDGCWDWVVGYDSNSNDTGYYVAEYYGRHYTGSIGVFAYSLCAADVNNKINSLTTTGGTGTSKVANTIPFRPQQIYGYNGSSAVAANTLLGHATTWQQRGLSNVTQYTFNGKLPVYQMIYLCGTYNTTTGLFTLDNSSTTSWYKLVPYNTNNLVLSNYFTSGKDYIFIGRTYSSENYANLNIINTLYRFDGTNLIPYDKYYSLKAGDAATVNSHTVGSDVPANAVFTDTKNTAGSTDSSKKLFLIGAETQAANPQTYSQDTAYVGTDGKLYSNSKVVLTGGSNASSTVTITPSTTDVYSMTSAGSVTAGTANVPTRIDTTKFSGGSFTRGTFSQGTLPTLTFAMDTTDTKKLKITFGQGTLPTHAADSFTAAALQSGFYTAGTANTPTAVTLPGRSSSAIKAWTGYTAATAAAQTFTGSSS